MPAQDKRSVREIFEANAIRQDGCWGWRGQMHDAGYGLFSKLGVHYAHRASYQLHKGDIPHGMDVMHTCHNPACSNPAHLELGTRKENMATSFIVGRLQRRIPLADLPRIAAERAAGMTLQAIGDRYGCTKQAVRHMLKAHPELCHA